MPKASSVGLLHPLTRCTASATAGVRALRVRFSDDSEGSVSGTGGSYSGNASLPSSTAAITSSNVQPPKHLATHSTRSPTLTYSERPPCDGQRAFHLPGAVGDGLQSS